MVTVIVDGLAPSVAIAVVVKSTFKLDPSKNLAGITEVYEPEIVAVDSAALSIS